MPASVNGAPFGRYGPSRSKTCPATRSTAPGTGTLTTRLSPPSERDLGITYRDPRITLADTVAGLRELQR
jgi:dihydroflavonol-4-reductase